MRHVTHRYHALMQKNHQRSVFLYHEPESGLLGTPAFDYDEEVRKANARLECLERTIIDCETHGLYDVAEALRDKKREIEEDLAELLKLR